MTGTIVHVLGARPNFPKAAPVIEALANAGHQQLVVHTGQHYDRAMSEVFFEQLGLPRPDVNFGVGSGSHASQTAAVMNHLDAFYAENPTSLTVVYGDVNSTVAAALVCSKLHIPLAHVEAGLRSFDRRMPEEVNRLVVDALSDLLFTTSPDANVHLGHEGVAEEKIRFVGNPMIDTLLRNLDRFDPQAARDLVGEPEFVVATIHRPSNVDDPAQAAALVQALHEVADDHKLVIPLHPRGRAVLEAAGLTSHPRVMVIDPLGYIEFMGLVRAALGVITDSGGVQEESTVLGVPCFTLRENTERPVTITHGTNRLVTVDDLASTLKSVVADPNSRHGRVPPLWDGQAGERIAYDISNWLKTGK